MYINTDDMFRLVNRVKYMRTYILEIKFSKCLINENINSLEEDYQEWNTSTEQSIDSHFSFVIS